ncbi:MAG: GGDEF domain-containing protein [Ruminococcaceae bacterium]|nr:GGDEF domain-containing protein [Oscillospiraceae bacterium]
MKKRIVVGLLIDDLLNDYSQVICQGASLAAEEAGVDLVTIPVGEMFTPDDDPNWKNRHYKTMFEYPAAGMLDAIVVSVGTVFRGLSPETILERMRHFGNIPIVSIAVEMKECSCVRFDSHHGIELILNHLIEDHGCRRIAYVSGPLGNMDADDRLNAYINTLKRHGIPVDQKIITYGDFADTSRPVIVRLIDEHLSDIDAICCANDCMALIACKELTKRGVMPGKDIAVTGYDNMAWSNVLKPSITTVAAEASDLGYQAVFEALRLVDGESVRSVAAPTCPVIRESCGCTVSDSSSLFDPLRVSDVTEAVQALLSGSEYVPAHDRVNGVLARSWILRLEPIIRVLSSVASDPDADRFPLGDMIPEFRKCIVSENLDLTSVNTLHDILFVLRDILSGMADSDAKRLMIHDVILSLQRVVANAFGVSHYAILREARRSAVIMDNVRTDEPDFNIILGGILNQLCQMHISSSWIYLLNEPVPVSPSLPPQKMNDMSLRAYHIGDSCHVLGQAEGRIHNVELFDNPYVSGETRRNLVLVPLFTTREQYGLLLCEAEHEYYSHVNSICRQISSILETVYLLAQLNEQMDQMTLRYAALRNIASRDELTGCYNRRGFFEVSEHIARIDTNYGRRAVVAFVDLDNLKQINDGYGHDEGDNAIILASQALQKCFSTNSIIGRIGGDEYAVFDLISGNESIEDIHHRLKQVMAELDADSPHPYHVTVSAGMTEFQCNNEVVLRGYVDKADRQQYIDKKLKPTNVSKI